VAHPAPGYTFATIHLTQSAYAPERYDWLHGVVVYDVQGRWYRPKFTSYIHGESGGTFLFGLTTREENPREIYVVVEIPESTVIATIKVPQEIDVPTFPISRSSAVQTR
jgi:hypothetical protein